MRYIVTGGAGFIGSNIVKKLVERGDDVTVIDNLNTGKETNLESVKDKIIFVKGSVLDSDLLEEIVKDSPLSKENNKTSALAATFSASLELAKRGEIILEQNNLFESISVKIRK